MNGKQYIGRRISRYEGCGATRAVDGVALVVDEEHEYRAGNMDGYVMEITCPYGTQAMADALLAQLRGRTYTAYDAENAVMDPEAELGDGVTVNGAYTLLASRQMVLGSGHLCRIGAPADSEIDHEYGVADTYDRRIERRLAQSRSYIDKKSDEIRLGVESLVDDRMAEIDVTLDGITGTVRGLNGDVSTLKQTSKSLSGRIESAEGDIGSLELTASRLSGRIDSAEGDIGLLELTAKSLTGKIEGVDGRVGSLELTSKSFKSEIDGLDGRVSKIEQTDDDITLSVSGSLGGKATIKLSNGSSGTIDLSKVRQAVANDDTDVTITSGSMHFYNKTFAVDSDNLKITAGGSLTTTNSNFTWCTLHGNGSEDDGTGKPYDVAAVVDGNIYLLAEGPQSSKTIYGSPGNDGNISLVYASKAYNNGTRSAVLGYVPDGGYIGARINGSVISMEHTPSYGSDRDIKKDIADFPERYMKLLDEMRPVVYRYKEEWDSRPLHWGYIAQEMEEAITRAGMTRDDAAALVGEDGTGQMGIGYAELIPLLHMKIRQLERRLERLEAGA